MDPETSSSAACRIVVVSSSLDTSREVAHRIKSVSGDTSEIQTSSEVIHWTIKNKYYTAPVHFHPIHLEGLESIELDDVPAVIYAWKENEPYKVHMKHVAEQTSSYNPEVSLAISMEPCMDEELEDFFFEHGYEYIEGHTQAPDKSAGISCSSETLGIYRAVDALSTIMWPSMVQAESKKALPGKQHNLSAQREDGDEVDLDFQALVNASDSDGKLNMQREMEILEKWLEEDDETASVGDKSDYTSLDSHESPKLDDPWATTAPSAQTGAAGFDDDFTEFISASSPSSSEPQRDNDGDPVGPDDDSDADLPSKADIRAASTRIFGPPFSHSTRLDAFVTLSDDPLSMGGEAIPSESVPELDMDGPAFDLTHILGALDNMKEEISRIPDMRERRHAAAKAALGLVYGLEDTKRDLDAAVHAG